MSSLEEAWRASPARTFSYADHLPPFGGGEPTHDIHECESWRQNAALGFVVLSGEELGRDSDERRQYLAAAGERYAGVRFLAGTRELYLLQQQVLAAGRTFDDQPGEIKTAIIHDINNLRSLGNQLLGEPNLNRFNAIMARAHRDALFTIDASGLTDEVRSAAQHNLDRLPPGDPELVDQYVCEIPKELADHWYPIVAEKYRPFLELIEPGKVYDSEMMVQLFNQTFEVMRDAWDLPNAARWHAQIWNGGYFNTNLASTCIRVPHGVAYTANQAHGLQVHEAGVHVLRSLNGEKAGDALLASGLPGYNDDEEGLCEVLEQIASQERNKERLTYDAAIGLATFADVPLAELEGYCLDLEAVQHGRVFEGDELLRLKRRVHRVTQGMPSFRIDGRLHQITYNADLKYTLALPRAVAFLERHRANPSLALDWVMGGKFAYSDAEHVNYYAKSSEAT